MTRLSWKRVSIILLIITCSVSTVLIYTIVNNRAQQEQYFLDHIQLSLIELQGIIASQKEHNWDSPRLVIQQLDKIRNTIVYGNSSRSFSILSNDEKKLLMGIYFHLERLPNDTLYELASWTSDNTRTALEVEKALINANFKLNTGIENSWKPFMQRCEKLNEELFKMNETLLRK
ncbi:hypothetical protein [Paenibacillus sp. GCM10027626]|uniref:hypothetical protein n=1 Tax=Paenibacillus sp. GCM10027626 TaxID=3273411 RepID=UPI00364427F9